MKISKTQIEKFIPQRAPFIMIDNLIDATEDRFETNFRVRSDNIFLEGNELREFGLIENIAQSSAAGIAFLNRTAKRKPVDGFIGGISKVIVHHLPMVDDDIHTIIHPLNQLGNMFLLRGENFANGKMLMECKIKLVVLVPNQRRD